MTMMKPYHKIARAGRDKRKIYLAVSDSASAANEPEESYAYLLKALRTLQEKDASSSEARTLSVRAIKAALMIEKHFDFNVAVATGKKFVVVSAA